MNAKRGTPEGDEGRIWCIYVIMAADTVAVSLLVVSYLGVWVVLFWLLAWFFFKWLGLGRILGLRASDR